MFLGRARWVTDKYILVMLGLFPLFWGEGYVNITKPKFLFFAIATGIWTAAVLALLVIGAVKGERYYPEIRPVHLAMAVFLGVGALSACASEYGSVCLLGGDRFDGYLTAVLYGLIFFGVSWLGGPKRRYLWALAFSVTVCCIIAALQLGGLDPLHLYPGGTNYYDKYVVYNSAFLGTIGNTGLLAAYLCLSAPALIVYGVLSAHRRDTLLILPGALALSILALCDVDAGIVALAGCLLVTVPVVMKTRKASLAAGCCSGGIALAGLVTLYFWPGTSGTLWEASQLLHGNLADEFGSHRGQIWKRCWELFLEKPWLGSGPGTACMRMDISWTSEVRHSTVSVQNAHNVYLGYLVNIGIFGLLSYLAAAVCSFITWLRRRNIAFYAALGSGVMCYMIQDFFGLGLSLTEPLLWIAWALLESEALSEPAEAS